MSFQVGAKVEWTSQGGGGFKTKRGEVVAVIPRGRSPWVLLLSPDFATVHGEFKLMLSAF